MRSCWRSPRPARRRWTARDAAHGLRPRPGLHRAADGGGAGRAGRVPRRRRGHGRPRARRAGGGAPAHRRARPRHAGGRGARLRPPHGLRRARRGGVPPDRRADSAGGGPHRRPLPPPRRRCRPRAGAARGRLRDRREHLPRRHHRVGGRRPAGGRAAGLLPGARAARPDPGGTGDQRPRRGRPHAGSGRARRRPLPPLRRGRGGAHRRGDGGVRQARGKQLPRRQHRLRQHALAARCAARGGFGGGHRARQPPPARGDPPPRPRRGRALHRRGPVVPRPGRRRGRRVPARRARGEPPQDRVGAGAARRAGRGGAGRADHPVRPGL